MSRSLGMPPEIISPSIPEVFDIAMQERQRLEQAWSPETAHHSVADTLAGEPLSRGQCGVSSVWLARRLMEQGYMAQVAEGTLAMNGLAEGFVWVHLETDTEPLIVDITSDQFRSLHGVTAHVGEYGSGPGTIGAYELAELFDPYSNIHRKLMRRYALLERNVAQRSTLWSKVFRGFNTYKHVART